MYEKLLYTQLLELKSILLYCFNLQWVVPFVTVVLSDLNIPYISL
jgi:hypothetical protein